MQIRSLGYRSDLIFLRFAGEVVDRGHYLVVRTPSNPAYRWGNFLLFDQPPQKDDFGIWRAVFKKEIGDVVGVSHFAFGWDSPEGEVGEIQPFLERGFALEHSVVLTAQSLDKPVHFNDDIEIRLIQKDADWQAVLQAQIAARPSSEAAAGFADFRTRKMAQVRRMADAGKAAWFGAFLQGRLIGDLGLVCENGLARFQNVETHPAHRRRGVCRTLIYHAMRTAKARFAAETFIIVAEKGHEAQTLYQKLGFQPVEQQIGIEWHE